MGRREMPSLTFNLDRGIKGVREESEEAMVGVKVIFIEVNGKCSGLYFNGRCQKATRTHCLMLSSSFC